MEDAATTITTGAGGVGAGGGIIGSKAKLALTLLALLWLLWWAFKRYVLRTGLLFRILYKIYTTSIGYYLSFREEVDRAHSITNPLEQEGCTIVPVAIRSDNYAYLIINKKTNIAAAIDPSDPKLVLKALKEHRATLGAILTTHKHWDHAGGNYRLIQQHPNIPVYGSSLDKVSCLTNSLTHQQKFKVGNLRFTAIECKVHTPGHLMYLYEPESKSDSPSLFSGDAIFLGGAGKFFESKPIHFYQMMAKSIKQLPKETLLWPGHEYAVSNLSFAAHLEPENPYLMNKLVWVKQQRDLSMATVPSKLEEEFNYNPYFRYEELSIQKSLKLLDWYTSEEEKWVHTIGEIRRLKDEYGPKPANWASWTNGR